MSDKTFFIPEPAAPCAECVKTSLALSEEAGFVWCSHTRTGGIFTPALSQWTCTGPFECEEDFRRYLGALVQRGAKLKQFH